MIGLTFTKISLYSHFFLILCAFLPASTLAFPADVKVDRVDHIDQWSTQFLNSLELEGQSVAEQISTALFDMVADFDLVAFSLGNSHFTLHTRRQVIDNHDFNQTWTQIDRFKIEWDVPLYQRSRTVPLAALPNENLNFGFYIGTQTGISFADVRQVPAQWHKTFAEMTEDLKKVTEEFMQSPWYLSQMKMAEWRREHPNAPFPPQELTANPSATPSPSDVGILHEPIEDPTFFQDPANHARWGKIPNRLTFMFRHPFQFKSFEKMEDHELMTFTGTGAIQSTAGITWNFFSIPNFLDLVEAGVNGGVLFEDDLILSVLKLSPQEALVRVSEPIPSLKQLSRRAILQDLKRLRFRRAMRALKSTTDTKTEINLGFFTKLESIDLRKVYRPLQNFPNSQAETLQPFAAGKDWTWTHSRDFEYRYLLSQPEAKQKFEHLLTHPLSITSQKPEIGITREFEGDLKSYTKTWATKFSASIFGSSEKKRILQEKTAVALLPDGPHEIIQKSVIHSLNNQNGFGAYRRTNRTFTAQVDLNNYKKDTADSFTLLVENTIEKSRFTASKMSDLIQEIEQMVGTQIFPKIAAFVPGSSLHHSIYGASSFFYGFTVLRPELEKFLSIPDQNKLNILSTAAQLPHLNCFDHFATAVDSAIHLNPNHITPEEACRFFKNWKLAQDAPTILEKNDKLRELVSVKNDIPFWMKIIRNALQGEKLEFFVTAQSASFGRIQFHKELVTHGSLVLNTTDQESNIELLPAQLTVDQTATFNYATAEVINKPIPHPAPGTASSEKAIQLKFGLSKKPRWIWFILTHINDLGRSRILDRLVYLNPPDGNQQVRFNAGDNEMMISETSLDEIARLLFKSIKPRDHYLPGHYLLQMGYSADATHSGAGINANFYIKE